MANFPNIGIDINVSPAANALTTTAEFRVASPQTVTAAGARVLGVHGTTTTGRLPVGIFQDAGSASADVMRVRISGVSRALVSNSIEAWNFVQADSTGSIKAVAFAGVDATLLTAQVQNTGILGMALEPGQTGQTINIIVNPHYSGYGAV